MEAKTIKFIDSRKCNLSKLMTEEEENPFTPDADDIESAAPAEVTIDNDYCVEIEVDWYMYFRRK